MESTSALLAINPIALVTEVVGLLALSAFVICIRRSPSFACRRLRLSDHSKFENYLISLAQQLEFSPKNYTVTERRPKFYSFFTVLT